MKTIKSIILVTILFMVGLNSCDYYAFTETVYGDGNVVTKIRDLSGFDGIKVSSGIDVFIKQGNTENLKIKADKNLHEVIKTEVKNNTLYIYSEENIRKAKAKNVYVLYKNLEHIKISSSGDIKGVNTLETDELDISLSSAGDLDLDVKAQEIYISISSSGDANISGEAEYLKASLSSAGDLDAYDLKVKKCRINVSSAGHAKIHVTDELDATASSAGDIYYTGDPDIKTLNASSAGGIHKR
jgi:hypothetical protein